MHTPQAPIRLRPVRALAFAAAAALTLASCTGEDAESAADDAIAVAAANTNDATESNDPTDEPTDLTDEPTNDETGEEAEPSGDAAPDSDTQGAPDDESNDDSGEDESSRSSRSDDEDESSDDDGSKDQSAKADFDFAASFDVHAPLSKAEEDALKSLNLDLETCLQVDVTPIAETNYAVLTDDDEFDYEKGLAEIRSLVNGAHDAFKPELGLLADLTERAVNSGFEADKAIAAQYKGAVDRLDAKLPLACPDPES